MILGCSLLRLAVKYDVEKRFLEYHLSHYPADWKPVGMEWNRKGVKESRTGGWPDFAFKDESGSVTFYEVKRQGEKLQKNQLEVLKLLKSIARGVRVVVAVEASKGSRDFIIEDPEEYAKHAGVY